VNRDGLLRHADKAKNNARTETQLGNLEEAEQILVRLVAQLEDFLAEEEAPATRERTGTLTNLLAAHLADSYGMLGGVQRRQGDLRRAAQSYAKGKALELDSRFAVNNSYNLTNSLVVEIMLDPDSLATRQNEIQSAAQTLRGQVDGERRNQWWAWADYALLSLLSGDQDEVGRAYREFRRCGPRPSDYRSVLRVLKECQEAVQAAAPATAQALGAATELLTVG
jgi:hypothetical protein